MKSATSPVHTINVDIAMKYGLDASAFLTNLCFWLCHNMANKKHYFDGKYWTYNTQEAFAELLPYFSKKQVEYLIKKLEQKGVLIKGNFNETTYNRTCWYTVSDEIMALYTGTQAKAENEMPDENNSSPEDETEPESTAENSEMHIPKFGNAYPKNRKWISENSEMDILKSGNRNPKIGISPTDLNTADIPNLNHTAAVDLLKRVFSEISQDLIFDDKFYNSAAVFLQKKLRQEMFGEYASWLYRLVVEKKPKNLRYYYHSIFMLDAYIQQFIQFWHTQQKKQVAEDAKKIVCPVCGNKHSGDLLRCPVCECNMYADSILIQKMKIIYEWDTDKKMAYEQRAAELLMNGFIKKDELQKLERELDAEFGLLEAVST